MNGDAGYVGVESREENRNDEHLSKEEYQISKRKGADRKKAQAIYREPMEHLDYIGQPDWDGEIERQKSKVRSKVEHTFQV